MTDSSCDPSSALVSQFTARTCLVSMSTIRTITGQSVDELIRVRVRARNSRGWGAYSQINSSGATIETEPLAMSGLTHDITALTNTAVKLTWTAPALGSATGGSSNPITGYKIYWDQGTDAAWASLATTTNLFYPVNSLTGGNTYKFRIVAINKYSEGPLLTTSTFSIVTGQVPDQPTGVSTSLPSADSIYVQVSWTAPSANSYALSRYEINFLRSDGITWTEESVYCTGSDPSLVTCQVPMTTLVASPFSLSSYGANVIARVRARNSLGWGSWSA